MITVSSLFTFIAAFILPVGAAVWFSVKKKGYLKPVLLGVATFTFFQGIRLTLNTLVIAPMPSMTLISITKPLLYFTFFGVTAALFEEGGRFIVMRLYMKNRHRLADGIAFGIGHGGIEAVALVGLNAFIMLITKNSVADPGNLFAGGVERILVMIIQIAFSVMVLKAVTLKKPLWLLLAFVLHTVLDAGLVITAYGAPLVLIELYIGIFALFLLAFLVVEYIKFKGDDIV